METITLKISDATATFLTKAAQMAGVSFDQVVGVILAMKVLKTGDVEESAPQPPPADVRSVTTDALETLGMIHVEQQKRDAIHLAVEPVIAAMTLMPGEHITIGENGLATVATPKDALGIVDPFLNSPVLAGESFWLVVYPRQIRSLRHVWEHPKFPPSTD